MAVESSSGFTLERYQGRSHPFMNPRIDSPLSDTSQMSLNMFRLLSLNTRRFFSSRQLYSDFPPIKKSIASYTPILGKKLEQYLDENDFKFDQTLRLYIPKQYSNKNPSLIKEELLQHAQNEFYGALVNSRGKFKADRIMKRIKYSALLLLLSLGALAYYTSNRRTFSELQRSMEVWQAKRALIAQMDAPAPANLGLAYIQREDDEAALKKWITLNPFSVVYGSEGIGKSTLMDEIARQLKQEGHPVLLIRIDPTNPLKSFCDQLHIPVKQGESTADKLRPPPSLPLSIAVLRELTAVTKKQRGERPIVIIDQIDLLERIPGAIKVLRGVGEVASNYSYLPHLVYVTRDHWLNNHFASLGRAAPYLVHEMSEPEACKYLAGKFGIQSKVEQRDAYNRAGGVPAYLDMYNNPAAAPSLIDGKIALYLSKSRADGKRKALFVKLVQRLEKEGSVPADVALHLVGSEDFLTALQQNNILMKDQEYIQFHDSAVRNYLLRKGYC